MAVLEIIVALLLAHRGRARRAARLCRRARAAAARRCGAGGDARRARLMLEGEAKLFAARGLTASSGATSSWPSRRCASTSSRSPAPGRRSSSCTSAAPRPFSGTSSCPKVRGRHLFVVDRPGCGLSDGLDYAGVDLRRHGAVLIRSLFDALAVPRALLVGNLDGGCGRSRWRWRTPSAWPGWCSSARRPSRSTPAYRSRCACWPSRASVSVMMLPRPSPAMARARLAGVLGRNAAAALAPDAFAPRSSAPRSRARSAASALLVRAALAGAVAPAASEIATLAPPVLPDLGRRRRPRRQWISRARARRATEVRARRLAGAGHCPWADDAPAASPGAILRFGQDASRPAAASNAARILLARRSKSSRVALVERGDHARRQLRRAASANDRAAGAPPGRGELENILAPILVAALALHQLAIDERLQHAPGHVGSASVARASSACEMRLCLPM